MIFFFELASSYIANKRRAHTNSTPLDISTEISPMTGISEKRVKVIVRTSRNSRKIGQHRITKTTQYQFCPNQRSQVTKMRYQEGAEDSPTATSAPHPSALRRSSETWRLLRQWSKRKSKPSASGVRDLLGGESRPFGTPKRTRS